MKKKELLISKSEQSENIKEMQKKERKRERDFHLIYIDGSEGSLHPWTELRHNNASHIPEKLQVNKISSANCQQTIFKWLQTKQWL